MQRDNPIKVVLLDDEERALNRMAFLLNHFPEVQVLAQFQHTEEAIDYVKHKHPDLLFLDIEMPERTGLEVADILNKSFVETKLVFITSYDHYAIKAIKTNAFDYLLKPVAIDELQKLFERYKLKHQSNLTQREFEIIALIAQGLKSSEIAERLFLSRHTIDTYRRTILEKTSCKNSAELIAYAVRNGLV